MWLENYEIIELKESSKLDHSAVSYCLFTNANTFTSSHGFKLKNGNSVILMPLDRVLSIVWSSASWMMRSGHSKSQVAPWSLGHSYGAVFLKSGVPVTVQCHLPDGGTQGNSPAGRFGTVFPKPFLQPGAYCSSLSLISMFLISCIKFLFCFRYSEWFLFPDKSSAWYTCTDSCNNPNVRGGSIIIPCLQSEETEA